MKTPSEIVELHPQGSEVISLSAIEVQLVKLTEQLDAATTVADVLKTDMYAESIRAALKKARFSRRCQFHFFCVRAKAIRKTGDMLREMQKHKGGRPSEKPLVSDEEFRPLTYKEIGITYDFASKAILISQWSESGFQAYLKSGDGPDDDDQVKDLHLNRMVEKAGWDIANAERDKKWAEEAERVKREAEEAERARREAEAAAEAETATETTTATDTLADQYGPGDGHRPPHPGPAAEKPQTPVGAAPSGQTPSAAAATATATPETVAEKIVIDPDLLEHVPPPDLAEDITADSGPWTVSGV